jgi:hypothetical protein
MTLAAAYLTSDGVVFGADSTTTYSAGIGQVAQLLNHAQKIFEVGAPGEGRVALCTWGDARVGVASHRTIAARLADRLGPTTMVDEAADLVGDLVAAEARDAAGKSALRRRATPRSRRFSFGYFLGGWNPGTRAPECYRLAFTASGKMKSRQQLNIGDCVFEGAPEMFQRAFHGVDYRFLEFFAQSLKRSIGPKIRNLDSVIATALTAALKKIPQFGARDMPIREAIDMIHMYLHLTIKGFKFRIGAPVVGGPIEIGFISTDRLFRWVQHKKFSSAIFEEEVGHESH